MLAQTAIHDFLAGTRAATTIWLILSLLTTAIFAAVVAPAIRHWRDEVRGAARATRQRRDRLATHAAQLKRCAEELAVAADRAVVTAQQRRSVWLAANHAYEAVRLASATAAAAALRTVPTRPYQPGHLAGGSAEDVAARRLWLHRTASKAHRQGGLTIELYADILLGRGPWDPRRHPADLESDLLHAIDTCLRQAYGAAVALERSAWSDAEMATAASRSLRAEAQAAMAEANHANAQVAAASPRSARRRRPAEALTWVTP